MSERTARLDELLREEISAVIAREIRDPRVGFVTVTGVEVTPDLGLATVWVSVIGSDEERKASMRALEHAMPFVRKQLGGLRLRRIPQLRVRRDDTAERGTRVLRILDELEAGGLPDPLPTGETLPTPGPEHTIVEPPPPRPPRPVRPSRPPRTRRSGRGG